MLHSSVLATIGLLAAQSAAASVKRQGTIKPLFDSPEPYYDHDLGTPSDCTIWWNTDDGIGCDTVLLIANISVEQLALLNPSTKSCGDWKEDYSYCVASASGFPEPEPEPIPTSDPGTTEPASTTQDLPPTTTAPGNGVTTPEPAQPGMVDNCNRFYQVKSGDTCTTIASKQGVTIAQLAAWNTDIGGTACTGLWADYHICTGITGGSPTEPTPTDDPNPTPQPIQDGMVDNCTRFHLVESGDTCGSIAADAGVTVAQLAKWNTGIGGTACTGMWLGYYLCTGVEGGTPTEPTPTNEPNPTPQPIQEGMADNCNRFHLVESGDTCAKIASEAGISVAQLANWNKGIGGTACTGMWLGYYLCTGAEDSTPTEPPPTNPTPQPTQPGMVDNCKKFHLVKSGQSCDTIARQYGITVANFVKWNSGVGSGCTGLWADTYACVGV